MLVNGGRSASSTGAVVIGVRLPRDVGRSRGRLSAHPSPGSSARRRGALVGGLHRSDSTSISARDGRGPATLAENPVGARCVPESLPWASARQRDAPPHGPVPQWSHGSPPAAPMTTLSAALSSVTFQQAERRTRVAVPPVEGYVTPEDSSPQPPTGGPSTTTRRERVSAARPGSPRHQPRRTAVTMSGIAARPRRGRNRSAASVRRTSSSSER